MKPFYKTLQIFALLAVVLIPFSSAWSEQNSSSQTLTTLDPYARAKWLSIYTESVRDTEGWVFVGFGSLSLANGLILHALAESESDKKHRGVMHIIGGVLDGLGVGLGMWGTYLLLSNETLTNELESLDSVSKGDENRKQRGAELLLESYANQERMWRYITGSSAIAFGLASSFSPLLTKSPASAKLSSALIGTAAASHGVIRILFPTKGEDYWETYKRDRSEARKLQRSQNTWSMHPVVMDQDGHTKLGIGFSFGF